MSNISKTQISSYPRIPKANDIATPQFQNTSTQNKANVSTTQVVCKPRSKFIPTRTGYRNIEFKSGFYLENSLFFTNTGIVQGDISESKNCRSELTQIRQEINDSVSSLPIDLPSFQSFEEQEGCASNVFIQTGNVKDVVEITNSFLSEFKTSLSIRDKSLSKKSVRTSDAVYDIIRQQRLSWWSEDDGLPYFKAQSTSICFYKKYQRNIHGAKSEFSISSNYKRQRKGRVRKLELLQSEMVLKADRSPRCETKEPIVIKQKNEKSISWKNKFSDESEYEDSESSLEGSFRRNSSHFSDSSDCESMNGSTTRWCNHPAPPTSSRIFDDSIEEFKTDFQKTFEEHFWLSDLVKRGDESFIGDFGFIAVALQTLQCLCQCNDNEEL